MSKKELEAEALQNTPQLSSDAELIQSLTEENQTLKATVEGLTKAIEELNAALAAKDADLGKSIKPVVKLGKDSYELLVPKFSFKHNGKAVIVTKALLESDANLLKAVVDSGTTILRKKGGK
jgi:predicted RNase H-like nuclease (RuvC/YqgF family)